LIDGKAVLSSAVKTSELEKNILHNLNLIRNWLKNNKLLLNVRKSSYMIINSNHRNVQDMNISIDRQLLPRVNVVEILGINFDDRMCSSSHRQNIIKSLTKNKSFAKT
jgi:hypothetical protein